MSQGDGSSMDFPGIPAALVSGAQKDINFGLSLLHRESREETIRNAGLDLTDDQRSALDARLDEVANMSFQEALDKLREGGWRALA